MSQLIVWSLLLSLALAANFTAEDADLAAMDDLLSADDNSTVIPTANSTGFRRRANAEAEESPTPEAAYIAKKLVAFWFVVGLAAFLLLALSTTVVVCATIRVKKYDEKLCNVLFPDQ